jgi:hypothetical protein
MTTPAFMKAHIDYSWDADDLTPMLVRAPRIVHAAVVEAPGPAHERFQDYARGAERWRAACGATILAITTEFYDDEGPRACRRCAAIVLGWLDDENPGGWEHFVVRESSRAPILN